MELVNVINHYITSPPTIKESRARTAYYPSEASAISRVDGSVCGKCMRQAWYKWTGVEESNPINARGRWTFDYGNRLESAYIENAKQLGIWAGDHIKFYDPIHNISGEGDLFVFDPENTIFGVEIKTAYGYGFQKKVKEQPKLDNLMQVMLYLANFPNIKEWILVYHARDTQENLQYIISLDKDDTGTYSVINRTIPLRVFYLEDIYARYELLGKHVITKECPSRDFTYMYSSEQSASRFANGEISKSAYSAIKNKKKTDSDWQCLYCNYLDECWADKRKEIKD